MTRTRTTISLSADLLENIDEAVRKGHAASRNVFLATAAQRELDMIRRQALDREFESMTHDPIYQGEARKISDEYRLSDWEALRVAEGES